MMTSALTTVESRWAMATVVRSDAALSRVSWTRRSDWVSSELVASSRISTAGFFSNTRATERLAVMISGRRKGAKSSATRPIRFSTSGASALRARCASGSTEKRPCAPVRGEPFTDQLHSLRVCALAVTDAALSGTKPRSLNLASSGREDPPHRCVPARGSWPVGIYSSGVAS